MAIDLSKVLDWEKPSADETAMLEDLQGNILKGHGRAHTAHLFLNFSGSDNAAVLSTLRGIGRQLPSALDQLRDAKAFSTDKISAGRFLSFYLTAKGYEALGPDVKAKSPTEPAFRAGMLKRQLNDPAASELDKHFRQPEESSAIHGMLLIAHDSATLASDEARRWTRLLSFGGVRVLGIEYGLQHFNGDGEGIENFNYVDGRSQPLFLVQDIVAEGKGAGVTGDKLDPASWKWSPIFPLSQVLAPDIGGIHGDVSFGSFFVFRKLEQDVEGFKNEESEAEKSLADALGLKAPGKAEGERERAGAMVVGRYEAGTPFVEGHIPNEPNDPTGGPVNNFNFDDDIEGKLCPFRAHIRKTNPRGDDSRDAEGKIIPEKLATERSRIMARRGITYGERAQNENGDFVDRPRHGVGLLFMAYMADISQQFEVTQRFWANNEKFVNAETGIDPVIGQGKNTTDPQITWPDGYGKMTNTKFDFGLFVHMKGGEYFFAPSKSFLSNLKEEPLIAEGDTNPAAEPLTTSA